MVPNVYHLQQHRLGSTYATCTTRRIAEPVSSTRRQIVCNVLKLQFLPGKLPLIVLTPRQSRQIRSKALSTPATMSNEFIVKFRSFDKVEKNEQVHFFDFVETISLDIVAIKGNSVEATITFVERIVRLVAFDNVASILLLVWTDVGIPNFLTMLVTCEQLRKQWRRQAVKTGSWGRSFTSHYSATQVSGHQYSPVSWIFLLTQPGRQPGCKLFNTVLWPGAPWCNDATVKKFLLPNRGSSTVIKCEISAYCDIPTTV